MKKAKLTLIELLISMAIFSLMIAILLKAFTLTTEVSTRTATQVELNESATVALNIMSQDLADAYIGITESYYKKDATEYITYDKSSWFYFNQTDNDIRFFKKASETNKIAAIQYVYDDAKGLVRYEKTFSTTIANADFQTDGNSEIDIAATLSYVEGLTDEYYYSYIGVDSSSNRRFLPDLATAFTNNSMTGIDESVLIASSTLDTENVTITSNSFMFGLLFFDSSKSDGLNSTVTDYINGDKPESLQVAFNLQKTNDSNTNQDYSRSIPVNRGDSYGISVQ